MMLNRDRWARCGLQDRSDHHIALPGPHPRLALVAPRIGHARHFRATSEKVPSYQILAMRPFVPCRPS